MPILKILLPKLKQRENFIKNNEINFHPDTSKKLIWFHASSMGEFEQAKSVIELIKTQEPETQIICSFYSPSGYENQKNYEFADYTCYMPLDTKKNAKEFINIFKPDIAVFIRYDIWRNHLEELKIIKCKTFLINATQSKNNFYKKYLIGYIKENYNLFNYIVTINSDESKYFNDLEINSTIITSNDTRYDRIANIVEQTEKSPLIDIDILSDYYILVAGSVWQEDNVLIAKAVKLLNSKLDVKKVKVIYVLHEPTEKHLNELRAIEANLIKYSEIENIENNEEIKHIIMDKHIAVDSIGKLLKLYANADFAYIGGAFGAGVHSISEPAGYGVPLMCGKPSAKNYYSNNFSDAIKYSESGLLKIINSEDEIYENMLFLINNLNEYAKISIHTRESIFSAKGSSKKITNLIMEKIS